MSIKALNNKCFTESQVLQCDPKKLAKSPLVTAVALTALSVAILPFTVSLPILSAAAIIFTLYPHYLPRDLLYEIAIADLIVRERLCASQNWWHKITPNLYLGAIPLANKGHDKELKKMGVKSVFTILEDYEVKTETFFSKPVSENEWKKQGIRHKRLICRDMTAIPLGELQKAVQWVRHQVIFDKSVYVHCKAGRGRSAMVVIAYLIKYHQMSLKQAYAYALSQRSVIIFRPSQWNRLKEYEKANLLLTKKLA